MPCRDYESDDYDSRRQLKAQTDKLARIACKIMDSLVKEGKEDFILLQDDEVRDWWAQHQEADRKEKAREAEKKRREKVKAAVLAKLSDEEKSLLGIKVVKAKSIKT